MNGTALTLGAVGALALLGASRRGSRAFTEVQEQQDYQPVRKPKPVRKPLVPGFVYTVKGDYRYLAVKVYKGSKLVGGIDANWQYSLSSIRWQSGAHARLPQRHLDCLSDLRALGVENDHIELLVVSTSEIKNEFTGQRLGRAMYEALMSEAFDQKGPFYFAPMACIHGKPSTSGAAMRVWRSLAKDYPSSGAVLRVDARPLQGPSESWPWHKGSRASSSRYTEADVRALGYSAAEICKALSGMEKTPSGAKAGPTEAARMDTDYAGLDFTPPPAVRAAAMKGLRLRKLREARGVRVDPKTGLGRGGMWIGVGRAIQLATADRVPPRDVRRMADYHHRHQVDKRATGFGDEEHPSNGYIAWLLWGSDLGDEGKRWSERLVARMDAVDVR